MPSMLYPLVRIGLPQTGIQILKLVAPPLLRIVIVLLPEILPAGMVATMHLVALMPIITLPVTFTVLVTVTPFVTVFLIVVLATAGWCDGGH